MAMVKVCNYEYCEQQNILATTSSLGGAAAARTSDPQTQ